MGRVLAIDPGSTESGFVLLGTKGELTKFDKIANETLLKVIRERAFDDSTSGYPPDLVMERIASYGMPVGEDIFCTIYWSGRLLEAANYMQRSLVFRREVKLHLCASPKANDAAIRQRLIDLYGPGKDIAIGKKKKPGPLFGVTKDVWAALALGLSYQGGCPSTLVRDEANGE